MWHGRHPAETGPKLNGLCLATAVALACILTAIGVVPIHRARASEMRFEAPQGCGTEADFLRDLAALTGDTATPSRPTLLEITPEPAGYRLRLEVAGEVRELSDPDCRTLLRSALIITAAAAREAAPSGLPPAAPQPDSAGEPAPPLPAESPDVAGTPASSPGVDSVSPPLDPPRQQARTEASTAPSSPTGGRSVAAEAEARTAVANAEARRSASFGLAFGLGVSAGTLPGTSAALELRAGLDPAPVGGSVSVLYWPGGDAERLGRIVHVTGFGARAAAVLELGRAVHAALGLEVDRLTGSHDGVGGRNSDAAWRVAPALDVNLIPWSVDNLRLEFGFGAQVALVRPRFLVTGFGNVYRVPSPAGAAIIRGVWLFQ